MRIDYSPKFPTFREAEKEANRIREKVKRVAEQKGYAVQMLIGISDMDGKTKEARPPHLHIMFYACPCETLMAIMVDYINIFQRKRHLAKSAATKHGCDMWYAPYILKQSRKIRHYEHDPDSILKDFNIMRVKSSSFRKIPCSTERNTPQIKLTDTKPQLPCNNRATASSEKKDVRVIERISKLLDRKRNPL